MLLYIFLEITLLVLWLFVFWKSGWELFAPVSIAIASLVIGIMFSIIGTASWNSVSLDFVTVGIIVLGAVSITLGFLLCTKLLRVSSVHERFRRQDGPRKNDYQNWIKWVTLLTIIVICACLRIFESYSMANDAGFGGHSFAETMAWARTQTSSIYTPQGAKLDYGFSTLERFLEKCSTAIGFVASYCVARSISEEKTLRCAWPPALCLVACSALSLVQGARYSIIGFVVSFIVCLYVLEIRKGKSPKMLSKKIAKYCLPLAIAGLILFTFSSELVGRSFGSDPVSYISFWLGGGTPSLQIALSGSDQSSSVAGNLTFYNLHLFAYKIGLELEAPMNIPFMNVGEYGSNICTMFYRYYHDFGYPGVILLSFLFGMFYTWFYSFARIEHRIEVLPIYGMLMVGVFDLARDECLFCNYLSTSTIIVIALEIALLLWFRGKSPKERVPN